MHHRQVHEGTTIGTETPGQGQHQRPPDPGLQGLRVNRQRPQAGTVIRIIKGQGMINTGHTTDDLATVLCFGHQDVQGRLPRQLLQKIVAQWHHVARLVDTVDMIGVRFPLQRTDANAGWHLVLKRGALQLRR
ncbi:MAG: hypothetical protein R3E95_06500 [Thiolinea sp.]